jgi:hypothetical protein
MSRPVELLATVYKTVELLTSAADQIDDLCAENTKLRTENTKLRDTLLAARADLFWYCGEKPSYDQIEAILREVPQ